MVFNLASESGIDAMRVAVVSGTMVGLLVSLCTLTLPGLLRVTWVVRGTALLCLLIALDVCLVAAIPPTDANPVVHAALLLAGSIGFGLLITHKILTDGSASTLARRALPLGLVAMSISAYSIEAFRPEQEGVDLVLAPIRANRDLVEDLTAAVYTDQHMLIPVFTDRNWTDLDSAAENECLKNLQLDRNVTHSTTPETNANCHGWVFTGGLYHVKSKSVEQILDDNNYQLVSEPREGDLIVYRNGDGNIVHTGLVRAGGSGGSVLIESKWGSLGHFLHGPTEQPYGPNFTYYHTSRPTHLLAGLRNQPEFALHSEGDYTEHLLRPNVADSDLR